MTAVPSTSELAAESPPDVDVRWAWAPVVLVMVALVALVWFARDMTFYHDEWAFILQRDLSFDGLLKPHNEHLSATLVLLYRVLIGTVGLGSYWPYLAVTFALHVAVAVIVYVVVRREAGEVWALGAMAVVLLLGSGGDDILWAFQSPTIGAWAAGRARRRARRRGGAGGGGGRRGPARPARGRAPPPAPPAPPGRPARRSHSW